MQNTLKNSKSIGVAMFFIATFSLSVYFCFAAIQGDFGHFKRVQVTAMEQSLTADLKALEDHQSILLNKTKRMSDTYLDIDLLDEQARKILGMARGSEIILR